MKRILERLYQPSAFKLGLLVAGSFVVFSFFYYARDERSLNKNWLFERIKEVDNKSIDIRMRDRGQLPTDPNIAIVVVDELAEQKLGRWPWPRSRIAEIIDLLASYKAKVTAFDAVFVEPDRNQAVTALTKLKESNLASGELSELIDQQLRTANTDWVLAKAVEKNSSNLVLGTYFDSISSSYYPHQEFCATMVFSKTPWYARLTKEESPAIVSDSVPDEIPEAFKPILEATFTDIENKVKKEHPSKPAEEVSEKVLDAKLEYCDRWMNESGTKDEYLEKASVMWNETRASVEGWSDLTYSAAIARITENTLRNPIKGSGRWWQNLPILMEGTKHTAYFNAFQDKDGPIRRTNLITRHGDLYMTSLAFKAVLVANGWNVLVTLDHDPNNPQNKTISKMAIIDAEGTEIRRVPVDGSGRILINYAGDQKSYPHVSISQLFNNSDKMEISIRNGAIIDKKTVSKVDFFKDKYLLFGATSVGIFDLRVTPFSENFPGVETHANVIDNILNEKYLVTKSDEDIKMLGVLTLLGIFLALGIARLGAVQGMILTLLTIGGIYVVDRYYLFANGIIVTIILPLFMVSSMYVILTFYKYLTEERKKKALKGTFEKYVSPAIVAEVLKHPDNVALGGKKQRMTVMFSDLRGFTTISEKLDPQVLVEVLNKYLTPMTALVFKNSGTLDKYMGDAIMSFFGAPLHYADHAKKCCQCAIEMIDLLPKINQDFKAQGLPTIDVGIGINTGEMSVGNMGSETVRSFTVMGDAVNLGSRLEGINKQYGTRIIISEYTYEDVKDEYVAREVDWVRVKGKRQPVRIFELIAHKSKFKNHGMIEEFQKGFEAYHQKSWDQAIDHFTKALILVPNDPASRLYVERSQDYKAEPPPDDWDGVYEMKTK